MPVDPQCQTILEAAAAKGAPFAHDDVHASRAAYAGTTAVYRHAAAPLASVSERTFPGPADDVPVRLYIPATDAAG
ncbi:MAG: alpha/beta hydrolase, partial [Gammaproteobacteria bacterium]